MKRKLFFLIFAIGLCGCENMNSNMEIQEKAMVISDSHFFENENLADNSLISSESNIEESGVLDGSSELSESETIAHTEEEAVEFIFWDKKGIEHSVSIDYDIEMHSYNWEGLITEDEYKYYYEKQKPLLIMLQTFGPSLSYQVKPNAHCVRAWFPSNKIYHENDELKSQIGIDVSEYQGEIDWDLVKSAGIDFAFIRLGYRGYGESGSLNIDSRFEENISGALGAGLEVGVYFFSQAVSEEEAAAEAVFILEHIEMYEISYPIAYDLEFIEDSPARTDGLTKEQLTANCIAFCQKIENYGYTPLIYTDMLREATILDLKALSDYAIWYSDYEDIPQTPYQFVFWQFTEKGQVNGVSGYVDINIRIIE